MRPLRRLRVLARGQVTIPASVPADTPVPTAVAAEQTWPRLRVYGDRQLAWRGQPARWWWSWQVTNPDGSIRDGGVVDGHAEALAVGLAHLAVASAAWAVDQLGASLPPGWQRVP